VEKINRGSFELYPSDLHAGDEVQVLAHDDGYSGKTGKILSVYRSGRIAVQIGPVTMLNLKPEQVRRLA